MVKSASGCNDNLPLIPAAPPDNSHSINILELILADADNSHFIDILELILADADNSDFIDILS